MGLENNSIRAMYPCDNGADFFANQNCAIK